MVTNEHAFNLAMTAAKNGGKASVARQIGYTRGAVSQYLGRYYAANPAKIEAAILARYDVYICTHTEQEISGPDCTRRATAPRPFGGRAKEAHWLACQTCPHNKSGDKS